MRENMSCVVIEIMGMVMTVRNSGAHQA